MDQIDLEDAREAKKETGESIPLEALKKKLDRLVRNLFQTTL